MHVTKRTRDLLQNAGLALSDTPDLNDADLLKIKGVGSKTLAEIRTEIFFIQYDELLTELSLRNRFLGLDVDGPPIPTQRLASLLTHAAGVVWLRNHQVVSTTRFVR